MIGKTVSHLPYEIINLRSIRFSKYINSLKFLYIFNFLSHRVNKIVYIIFFLISVISLNCGSSSLNIVELSFDAQRDEIIEIMPFSASKKRLAEKDIKWRRTIPDILDKQSGLYTSLDDKDYENLRQSLIQSLRESKGFKEIHDIQNEKETSNGVRVYISFDESGVDQTGLFSFSAVCFIKAFAWTEIAKDSVLVKKEIATKGKSRWSAGGAKNDAMIKFIGEIAQLISGKSK